MSQLPSGFGPGRPGPFVVQAVDLRAEIELAGSWVELPAVSFRCTYAVNEVPTASLGLALGRRADGGRMAPSAAQLVARSLGIKRRVRVYATVTAGERTTFLPGGMGTLDGVEHLLFEGWTTGPGYQRTDQAARLELKLEHWLAGLSYASAVSATSHPSNPSALVFNAADPGFAADAEGGAAGENHLSSQSMAEQFFAPDSVLRDLWGDAAAAAEGGPEEGGIRPWFQALCRQDTVVTTAAGRLTGGEQNADGLAALARFEPRAAEAGYRFGTALRLDATDVSYLEGVASAIGQAVAQTTLESLTGVTLWDKLLEFAGQFMFGVVPCVDRALVVPLTPGLRTVYRGLLATENGAAQWSGDSPRLLRGLGVCGAGASVAGIGFGQPGEPDWDRFGIGGAYVNPAATTGQLLFKQAPAWMAGAVPLADAARFSSGGGATVVPTAASPEVEPDFSLPSLESLFADASVLMNRYARALYAVELLKGRQGDVSGPYRVDVAPGSTVRVSVTGDAWSSSSDQLALPFVAMVAAVTLTLDAEAPQASASFHLAHIRSEAENRAEGTSLDRHPLWADPWSGAPLVDGAAAP